MLLFYVPISMAAAPSHLDVATCSKVGFFSLSNFIFLIASSRSSTPFFRKRVTFRTLVTVSSFNVSNPFDRWRAIVLAVKANRISFGPSTSSRIALGA